MLLWVKNEHGKEERTSDDAVGCVDDIFIRLVMDSEIISKYSQTCFSTKREILENFLPYMRVTY
jgi:hypothetical protein